jgi:hypothetical protein
VNDACALCRTNEIAGDNIGIVLLDRQEGVERFVVQAGQIASLEMLDD